jgi:hypothetical protein
VLAGLTTRRDVVDRGTATMVFASWDRSASVRRWVPQNLSVRAARSGGRIARGGRVCGGGASARRDWLERFVADYGLLERGHVELVGGGHLSPEEPGELARDRDCGDGADVLVRGELTEPVGAGNSSGPLTCGFAPAAVMV